MASKKRYLRWVGWAGGTLLTLTIVGIIALFLVIQHYTKDLPSVSQLSVYNPPVTTRLYSADGKLLAEYATEKRLFVPLSAIPKQVQHAFMAAEDRNFYTHQGVDFIGVLRAIRSNIANYGTGRSMVGGSTITQQVVKNFLLTSEKSFERKIKEAILAYRISKVYTKDKILELYLNEIYLGQGTYGVAAAALHYFNKSLDTLSTEDMAMLAAMPKAPSFYDPAKNIKATTERRNYVIRRMQDDGYIDETEAKRALATDIVLGERDTTETAQANYFAEEVRRRIAAMYGSDVLYKGGLFVKTTVNPAFQEHADNALRNALRDYDRRHGFRGPLAKFGSADEWGTKLEAYLKKESVPVFDTQAVGVILRLGTDAEVGLFGGQHITLDAAQVNWAKRYVGRVQVNGKTETVAGTLAVGDVVLVQEGADKKWQITQVPEVNGAMVVLDAHTGRVLAMSGGYGIGGPDQFNRATQAKRQPGSAFKPFVYLTALENGFTPSSVVVDGPIELPQGPGLPPWRPKNYEGSYLGPTTLRKGLEKSRNTMTVRLAVTLGINRIKRMGVRFGIYGDKEKPDLSMVLGAHETTLLQLANAYAMVVNGGRKVEPALIERIDDRNGITIYRRDARDCMECRVEEAGSNAVPPTLADDREQVVDARVAYQLTSILEGVVLRGTAASARSLDRPLGGKTGTTNDSRDAWFIGFTPDYVIGTYIGYDTPRSLGAKETGGRVALPAFINFVKNALKDEPKTAFRVPSGIQMIAVNADTGQPLYYGEGDAGVRTMQEAFIVGGEIVKPQSEVAASLMDPPVSITTGMEPQELIDAPFDPSGQGVGGEDPYSTYAPSAPSESGFDPGQMPEMRRSSPAEVGTGGLY